MSLKLTYDEVRKLVETRNKQSFIGRFIANKTKAHIIKDLWENIATEAGLSISGKDCKEKYNSLLKDCRKNIVISKKTGEGRITWKYWNLMRECCTVGHEILPPSAADSEIPEDEKNDDSIIIIDNNAKKEEKITLKKENPINKLISLIEAKHTLIKNIVTEDNEIKLMKNEINSLKEELKNNGDILKKILESLNK